MREIDRKCASILNWYNFQEIIKEDNEIELYGYNAYGRGPLIVPYYSDNTSIAFTYLIKHLKNKGVDIICAWYCDEGRWYVSLFDYAEKMYDASHENLATAISVAFISLHEKSKC